MEGPGADYLKLVLSGAFGAPTENSNKRKSDSVESHPVPQSDFEDAKDSKLEVAEEAASQHNATRSASAIEQISRALYSEGPPDKTAWIKNAGALLEMTFPDMNSDPFLEALLNPERLWNLQLDPATNETRPNEFETGTRLQLVLSKKLQRYQPIKEQKGDWADDEGIVYDDCSPAPDRLAEPSYRTYLRNANLLKQVRSSQGCKQIDESSLPKAALESANRDKNVNQMAKRVYCSCENSLYVIEGKDTLDAKIVELQLVQQNLWERDKASYGGQLAKHFEKTGANSDAPKAYVVIDLIGRGLDTEKIKFVMEKAVAGSEKVKSRKDQKPVGLIVIMEDKLLKFEPGDKITLGQRT